MVSALTLPVIGKFTYSSTLPDTFLFCSTSALFPTYIFALFNTNFPVTDGRKTYPVCDVTRILMRM